MCECVGVSLFVCKFGVLIRICVVHTSNSSHLVNSPRRVSSDDMSGDLVNSCTVMCSDRINRGQRTHLNGWTTEVETEARDRGWIEIV